MVCVNVVGVSSGEEVWVVVCLRRPLPSSFGSLLLSSLLPILPSSSPPPSSPPLPPYSPSHILILPHPPSILDRGTPSMPHSVSLPDISLSISAEGNQNDYLSMTTTCARLFRESGLDKWTRPAEQTRARGQGEARHGLSLLPHTRLVCLL